MRVRADMDVTRRPMEALTRRRRLFGLRACMGNYAIKNTPLSFLTLRPSVHSSQAGEFSSAPDATLLAIGAPTLNLSISTWEGFSLPETNVIISLPGPVTSFNVDPTSPE